MTVSAVSQQINSLFHNKWGQAFILLGLLLVFNSIAYRPLEFDTQNSTEAYFYWYDEGVHVESLEKMHQERTLKVIHPAYTAFYLNTSFLLSRLLSLTYQDVSSRQMVLASKWVSLIGMNAFLLFSFLMLRQVFASNLWALLGLGLLLAQRLHWLFAGHMHPEAWMLLWVTLAFHACYSFWLSGKSRFIYMGAVWIAFAIGSKLQAVFLLPFALAVCVLRWFFLEKKVTGWQVRVLVGAVLFGGLALLIASPYQVWHWQDLISGVQAESNSLEGYYANKGGMKWLKLLASETALGPFFLTLYLASSILGGIKLYQGLIEEGKLIWLDSKMALFILSHLWIIIGTAYIVLTYHVSVRRYLIHVYFAFILVIVLGIYWWWQFSFPKKRWLNLFGVLVIWAGVQGQWRHTLRDFERREKIETLVKDQRRLSNDIKSLLPPDAKLAHTMRVYIDKTYFSNTVVLFQNVKRLILGDKGIKYLIVNDAYRTGMRSEVTMKGGARDLEETQWFWNELKQNGINGEFEVLKHFESDGVTVYSRKKGKLEKKG